MLNALDALLRGLSPSLFGWGELNIVGLGNPLAGLPVNELLWGEVAGWTSGQNIVWGYRITNPSGQNIVWGYNGPVEGANVVWGFGGPP